VISCAECFLRSHRAVRWHWAHIWDPVRRIFSQVDYTAVSPKSGEFALQLGHSFDEVSCSVNDDPQSMIVVHSNGIHETKIRFCCCSDTDRVTQLIRAGLFPASTTFPQTAFTFTLLKQFQFHTRQSRASAFDWMVSLRRMTNKVAPHTVPVRIKSFRSHGDLTFLPLRIPIRRSYESLESGTI
jgi:hypothetical protein